MKHQESFEYHNNVAKSLTRDIRKLAKALSDVEEDDARLRLIESLHHLITEKKKNAELAAYYKNEV